MLFIAVLWSWKNYFNIPVVEGCGWQIFKKISSYVIKLDKYFPFDSLDNLKKGFLTFLLRGPLKDKLFHVRLKCQ